MPSIARRPRRPRRAGGGDGGRGDERRDPDDAGTRSSTVASTVAGHDIRSDLGVTPLRHVTISETDNRIRDDGYVRQLEDEVAALRAEVRRLRSQENAKEVRR